METVILCGCSAGEKRICSSLAAYGTVQCCAENRIWRRGEGTPVYSVYQFSGIPRMEALSGVLVLGSELGVQKRPPEPGLIPVFDSSSRPAAELLSAAGGIAVSCGTSPRDTFSLASFTGEKAVVSLQRNLRTFSGELLEPRDLTVKLCRGCTMFELMAFCAVLLLCGGCPEEGLRLD